MFLWECNTQTPITVHVVRNHTHRCITLAAYILNTRVACTERKGRHCSGNKNTEIIKLSMARTQFKSFEPL